MPTHTIFKDHSLYLIITMTAELVLLLTLLQARVSESLPVNANSMYGPMKEQRTRSASRSVKKPIRNAKTRRSIRATQATPRTATKQKSSARPAWIGRFSTQGLSDEDIQILEMQCATGVRQC